MRLAVIGTGYVGLVAGAGFSDFGNDVVCVDVDADRVKRLCDGEIPIHEPGLDDLVARNLEAGRLSFTTDTAAAVAGAEVVILAVGTPQGEDGSADLRYLDEAAKQVARALTSYAVIVTKSTVPVGTADRLRALIGAETTHGFSVASNPEFLKEGDAVNDFMKPVRVILGADDERAAAALRALYAPFVRTNDRVMVMDVRSAELSKYAANAMLAVRISFMNEIAMLAEQLGADVERVRQAIGADPRIGPKFLFPGPGFGGSCLAGVESVVVREGGTEVRLTRLDDLLPGDRMAVPAVSSPNALEVLALPELGGPPAFLPVSAITRRPFEGEIHEIRTKMGRRVRCTPDHPFVVVDEAGGAHRTVRADELSTDDWLPIAFGAPSNIVEEQPPFDVLWDLLGIGVDPEEVLVHIGERVKDVEVTEALRGVVRDQARLHDIRRTGTLRLDEAQRASIDLCDAMISTAKNGTRIPAVIPNTPQLWRILGLYGAEGWITTDLGRDRARRMRIAWSFHPRDEEHLVAEVVDFWSSLGVKASVYSAPTTRKVSISSRLLATWMLHALGVGSNCYDQAVPDRLWAAPREHKHAYLAGLWNGDGTWSWVSNHRGIVWEYGTVSRPLADGMIRLLGELGIVASWKVGRPPGSTLDTHFVRVSGASQVEQLLAFTTPTEHAAITRSIEAQTKRIAPTGYRMDGVPRVRIAEISRRHFQGDVYSLEVPGAHTFVTTAGLVVHNCFPKDIRALAHTARAAKAHLEVVEAADRANLRQKKVLAAKVKAQLGADLTGKRIAVWGLAFKPETDDIREAPALTLIAELREAGATVVGYDPVAMPNVRAQLGAAIEYADSMYDAARGADALVLVTEWKQFRGASFQRLRAAMTAPILFDGRNVWDPAAARALGFTYHGIGRP